MSSRAIQKPTFPSSMFVHPVIRVVLFLIFGSFVAYGQLNQLFCALSLLFVIYAANMHLFKSGWQMLRRMRWLFLSIFILYLWFTPGLALLPHWPMLSPSMEGLQIGVVRISALALVVLAVNLLVQSLSREQLVASVLWLLAPARFMVNEEKLAIRIALTLELITEVRMLNSLAMMPDKTTNMGGNPSIAQRVNNISKRVAEVFQTIIEKAEAMPEQVVVIPEKNAPPWLQWFYPIAVTSIFVLTVYIGK